MTISHPDAVKQQVAAHWDRRAPNFDEGFGHSIRTPAERAAWDRILDLVLPARGGLDALDAGCGTGFLALELAARGHRVTGVDFAHAMLAEARRKAAARGVSIRFEEADAERLPFGTGSFDLAISRHLLWTLPHPDAAIDEWIRVLRPGGRLVVVDGQFDPGALLPAAEKCPHEPGVRGHRRPATLSRRPTARRDRVPAEGARPRERGERPAVGSRGRPGAANGRGRTGAPDAPALRRLGRPRPLNAPRRQRSALRGASPSSCVHAANHWSTSLWSGIPLARRACTSSASDSPG
jgi:SAM-dependent methyltransferase